MTSVLVSDTSILIDLERGDLLTETFALPFTFAVPDLLYKQELHDENGPELIKLGLEVAELDGAMVTQAQQYRQTAKISLPDAFALSLAKSGGHILLTGDHNLRTLATQCTVPCHGLLWVLDQMNHAGTASSAALYAGLTAIAAHPRCRLPRQEIKHRCVAWAAKAGIDYKE